MKLTCLRVKAANKRIQQPITNGYSVLPSHTWSSACIFSWIRTAAVDYRYTDGILYSNNECKWKTEQRDETHTEAFKLNLFHLRCQNTQCTYSVLMVPFSLERTSTLTAWPALLSAFNCMTHSCSTSKVWGHYLSRGIRSTLFRTETVRATQTAVKSALEIVNFQWISCIRLWKLSGVSIAIKRKKLYMYWCVNLSSMFWRGTNIDSQICAHLPLQ